ncbi:MAG TPA: hypothetical protein PLS62_02535, partial [Desulfobacteraceae bacterium]|nr:hypothetical protein [Desulfobacteraceae bacterium]
MKTRKTASCVFRLFYILILFSAFIFFASVSSAATYAVYGGTKAYWPDGFWIPVPSLGDPDDGVTERLDFVGDTLTSGGDGINYAFYKYADSLYIYFRMRVDAGTWGGIKNLDPGGEWTDNIWIMLDANADNDPDYAIAWDSNSWDPGVSEPHGLEFQVIDKSSSTWSGTRFDDIDRLDSKKLVEAGTGPGKCNCECGGGNNCWHTDIPYSGGTGYVRIVDEQPTTTWGTTMFIDIAVTWSYLVSASSKANECNPNLPVLSAYGTWKLQMGSRNNANDHAAISTDVGANSNPTDALVWSDETKPLPPDPVLTISKSAPLDVTVDPAGTDTIIQYTGVLTNTTQAYAYDVVLVDTLPGGVTFVASSHNAVYDSILNTVTWQLGTMGPGTFIPGWLAVKVDASIPNETVLTNQFSVTWKDFESTDFGPATATADTTVYSHPQLSVKKSGPLSAIHNEQFSYNITIRNVGDSPAFHIALEDALPPGLAYVGSSPSGTYNSGPPAMVIWNDLGGLEANSFKIVTVTVKVNDTVPNATVLMDTVNLIWEDSLENSYGPLISSADTTIYALPHLEITKSGPLEAEAGSMITYTGELTNTGGTAAGNVVLV